MMRYLGIWKKGFSAIQKNGPLVIFKRLIFRCLFGIPKLKNAYFRKIAKNDIEEKFTKIYKYNLWGNLQSASGGGSTPSSTVKVRDLLPKIISDLNVRSMCDAPCGDFSWIEETVMEMQIDYLGIDIVQPLIEKLSMKSNDKVRFKHANLLEFNFPPVDLIMVRDCLFHFSFEDIDFFLRNLNKAEYKYLLTTSYATNQEFTNQNIITGDFRPIDLFKKPFNFPLNFIKEIPDWEFPEDERYLYLWSKEDVPYKCS